MKYLGLLIFSYLLLTGCGPRKTLEQAGPPPVDYRSTVAKEIKESYFDPYSIRDAKISKPFLLNDGWSVCVSANAKNRMGGYVGQKFTRYIFSGNKIINEMDEYNVDCAGIDVFPFPEIEMKQ